MIHAFQPATKMCFVFPLCFLGKRRLADREELAHVAQLPVFSYRWC